ncbi:CoA pyrophosphatase [Candidatus Bathyarchaeota archaeon]|nr:CoA pyrophosphatase [Candidatus Bathyarchaeota archaeon]
MDYNSSITKLSNNLRPITAIDKADAAVSLLLRLQEQNLEALLVRRVENPNDLWSGQMALPGGKRDPKDHCLKQTAIRETLEETSIDLTHRCRFLGSLRIIRSEQKPDMKILPLVIFLEHNPSIRLNDELVLAFWISIDELIRNRKTVMVGHRKVHAFLVKDACIWGLTYRILSDFLEIVRKME